MNAKQKIFISYSHKDKEHYDDFFTHLDALKQDKDINVEFWSDVEILAGGSLDEIFSKLEDSTIFVALVSPDYLYSESCKKELERAFELKRENRIIIIPVIIRECIWKYRFGGILAIPEDGKAITSWDNKDEAFTSTIKKINKRVEDMNSKQEEGIAGNKIKKINKQVERMNSKQEEGIAENKIKKNEIESHQIYRKKENLLKDNLKHSIDEISKVTSGKITVFLGGPDLKYNKACKKAKLRDKILKALKKADYTVLHGKDKEILLHQEKTGDNAQQSELKFIKDECQAVVIIAGSPGSFCEFGLFSWHFAYGNMKKERPVFIALVDKEYEVDKKSYFNKGPIKALEVYGRVIKVNYDEDYKEYIEEVKNILSSANSILKE